jgi:hypothetical protein
MASKVRTEQPVEEQVRAGIFAVLTAAKQPLGFFDIVRRVDYPHLRPRSSIYPGQHDAKMVVTMKVLEDMMARRQVSELWNDKLGQHTYRLDCSFCERLGL